MAIRKDYVNNMQFFLILIVCSVYQNTNASKKTIAKLKKCQKNFQDIYKRIAEPKQNNDVESKKSESLQTEGRHFRSMICKLSDV